MGAYENAMLEEGTCKDFAREIVRTVDKMLAQENRTALSDIFIECRKVEIAAEINHLLAARSRLRVIEP